MFSLTLDGAEFPLTALTQGETAGVTQLGVARLADAVAEIGGRAWDEAGQ